MKILNIINDVPIRKKFIIVYVFFVLIPMVLVYGVFFIRLRGEVALRERIAVEEAIKRVQVEIENYVNSSQSIARDMLLDPQLTSMIDRDYESPALYYQTYYNALKDKIERYASAYNNVIRVSVYTDNPTIISGGHVYDLEAAKINSGWYPIYETPQYNEKLISWQEPSPFVYQGYHHRVSLFRNMAGFSQYNHYRKIIRIDIEKSLLEATLSKEYLMDFALIDDQGLVRLQSLQADTSQWSSGHHIQKPIRISDQQVWWLRAYVHQGGIADELAFSAVFVIVLFLISLSLSLLMVFLFSHAYNSRISLLQKHMQKVENSVFEIIETPSGKDEIGYLIQAFNSMTNQINSMINEILALEIKDREHQLENVKAELKFLQSQMDPHFLFNTLNAIMVVAKQNDYAEITDIIKYLSKTMRHLLDWKDVMVDIHEEIQFTKMYLEIEKFRFRDKFTYEIYVEDGLEGVLIPKMTLQPFVENACKHGIQGSKLEGLLQVRIYTSQDKLNMIVKDNGIGMSKNRIDAILSQDMEGHVGIQNVLTRLKLHYNSDSDFHIQSQEGSGTSVMIQIPIVRA